AGIEHSLKLQRGITVFDRVARAHQHRKPVAGIHPEINKVCGHPATPSNLGWGVLRKGNFLNHPRPRNSERLHTATGRIERSYTSSTQKGIKSCENRGMRTRG